MSDLTMEVMNEQYYDVLKEIGNIGAGNATTALATMLNCKVDMSVPQVILVPINHIGDMIGGEEQIMAGVYLTVEGDITGSIMFLLEEKSAKHLVSKLMGMPETEGPFTEMDLSALKEVGNIITGSYLNSLSMMTNLKIFPSIPDLAIDMAGAILSVPAIEFGTLGDQILLIQTKFFDEIELDGFFILIPDMESYGKILASLGIQV